jgi:hypothetical protein
MSVARVSASFSCHQLASSAAYLRPAVSRQKRLVSTRDSPGFTQSSNNSILDAYSVSGAASPQLDDYPSDDNTRPKRGRNIAAVTAAVYEVRPFCPYIFREACLREVCLLCTSRYRFCRLTTVSCLDTTEREHITKRGLADTEQRYLQSPIATVFYSSGSAFVRNDRQQRLRGRSDAQSVRPARPYSVAERGLVVIPVSRAGVCNQCAC